VLPLPSDPRPYYLHGVVGVDDIRLRLSVWSKVVRRTKIPFNVIEVVMKRKAGCDFGDRIIEGCWAIRLPG
jgi:hypothetical protein